MKKIIFIILCLSVNVFYTYAYEISDYYNSSDLSDYFGTMKACSNDGSDNDCRNGNEYKFYLKMYDLYYLYQNKYHVNLDLPLIMAALYYNNEELPTVFANNLNRYDRTSLNNNDIITNLDWEYDFKKDPCYTYLNANDFSYDMQILAKNMVRKTTKYKCISDDSSKNSDELEAKDIEKSNYSKETLKCENGEYDKGSLKESYEKDDAKYKDFLLEYVKLKYHTPGSEVKSCGAGINGGASSFPLSKTGQEAVDKMNDIALAEAEAGTGPQKFWSWYGMSGDWCAMFVSWLFNQIDGLGKYYVKTAAAGPSAREPIKAGYGTWLEDECTDPTTVPRPGDVLHWKVADPGARLDKYSSKHVGYVYAVDDTYIYTVEGNNDPYHVRKLQRRRNDCNINGYYRANF